MYTKKSIYVLILCLFSVGVYAQTETEVLPNVISSKSGNYEYSIRIGHSTGSIKAGVNNLMIGRDAGRSIVATNNNIMIGNFAGTSLNTSMGGNTFLGFQTGRFTTSGQSNTFVGYGAGYHNTTGIGNTFVGLYAGGLSNDLNGNKTGNYITLIGHNTKTNSNNLSYATALGAGAEVSISNAIVLGKSDAFVGIGTSAPSAKLEIKSHTAGVSGLKFTDLTSASSAITSNGKVLTVDGSGNVVLAVDGGSSTTSTASGWTAASVGTNNIINTNTGGVIIGSGITSLPAGYKLYVAEGILAEKAILAVKNTTNWADYVFENDYKLRSLSEVERFIAQYKHLPEVPSASEVVKNGVNVAETQALLLKKIEELTLYIIAQEKQLKAQDEKLRKLEEGK